MTTASVSLRMPPDASLNVSPDVSLIVEGSSSLLLDDPEIEEGWASPLQVSEENTVEEHDFLRAMTAARVDLTMTPHALLHVDSRDLYRHLPLVLSTIRSLARHQSTRPLFLEMVQLLRLRVSVCPGIKLRFLTLTALPSYAAFWNVTTVYEDAAYDTSRAEYKAKLAMEPWSSDPEEHQHCIVHLSSNRCALMKFAIRDLLHPVHGVRMKTRKHRMHKVPNTFYAHEAVDWMLVRLGIKDRSTAVGLLQTVSHAGLIYSVTRKNMPFTDSKRVFASRVASIQRNGEQTCVVAANGDKIQCSKQLADVAESQLSSLTTAVQIEVTLRDIQSFDFWTRDVMVPVQLGHRFSYRALVHPLLFCTTDTSPDARAIRAAHVTHASVTKVFDSIAAPFILQLEKLEQGAVVTGGSAVAAAAVQPSVLVKRGDDLLQDMLVETMFRLFNSIWATAEMDETPTVYTYEIFPTGPTEGFMEAVPGLVSLKDYDWSQWTSHTTPQDRRAFVQTAAGAYVAAYVLGARDRHWDNILIKDHTTLLHIDFGFCFGKVPPVDAPRFSISSAMQNALEQAGEWEHFLDLAEDAYQCLRQHANIVMRAARSLFFDAGYDMHVIDKFLAGSRSLSIHASSDVAGQSVRKQLQASSNAWKTKLKSIFHKNIDPVFYGMIKKHFPPAMLVMKLVNNKRSNSRKNIVAHHS